MIRLAKSYDSTSSFHVPLSRVQASPHSKQLASVHDCQNWTCTAVELLVALLAQLQKKYPNFMWYQSDKYYQLPKKIVDR